MEPHLIEFHYGPRREPERFPHPYPAREHTPHWLASIAPAATGAIQSLHNDSLCAAAAGEGFIIPLAYDCSFTCDTTGNVAYTSSGPITTQNEEQFQGTWFESMILVKFANPWIIRTPPGYSTLIIPAINRFDIPFVPLSGLVETDSYYVAVNFPSLCTLRPGQTWELKRGTPLVQVIPILREAWRGVFQELPL